MPKIRTQKEVKIKPRNTAIPVIVEIDPSVGDKKTRNRMNARHVRLHAPNEVSARSFHIDISFENGAFSIMTSDAMDIIPHVSNHISISKRTI
jgi:hypothetical protein